ncbi:hypothetical protein BJY16_004339 [Actinoplanes octamycinicus]|uniref:Secreted protein n=1 Tax=Actinoplanes octamycinicus TaxID=135948 RepID=A0A7W7M8J6_9ACTN|nr:DUF6493 family protein [Actinoplanes octamycinicus]MBB4740880.1 hypothetical protein [Actinoplanes octamycinicus]GIE55787.1 hypothetical protein Aoc01nite_11890 [Actinoplanes octamycinicus]
MTGSISAVSVARARRTRTEPLSWAAIDHLARHDDLPGLTLLLLATPEEERVALAPAVDAGIKSADPDRWWGRRGNPNPGYALAVIGCMPSAARAAAALGRRGMRLWTQGSPEFFLEIARSRQLPWLGDLGRRLADRIPARDPWAVDWRFITAVLREGGVEPPVTEGFVRGWLGELFDSPGRGQRRAPLVQRMREDPYLPLLLPAVFEIDRLGAVVAGGSWDETTNRWESAPRFPGVVAELVAEGTLARPAILDLTVDRLLRGGKPHDVRPFVLLHDALAPTVDELAGHAADYARLLPEAPGTVATLAQRSLRAVDEAGRLELETLLEASQPTLVRTEKTLVKAQLSWLERVARRQPDRAGEVLETVAAAFGHPALDVQERALTLIGKQAGRLDPATVGRLAEASAALAGDLPGRAAELFGTVAEAPAAIPQLPPAAPPAELPPPIATAGELAEELVALCHEETAVRWERVLAGLVSLYTVAGSAALATALQPVLDRYPSTFTENSWNRTSPGVYLGEAIRAALDTERPGVWRRMLAGIEGRQLLRVSQRTFDAVRTAWQGGVRGGPDAAFAPTPDGVLALRVAEVAVQLTRTLVPAVVATPTHVTGSLDPAVLLDRLRRAEAEGWQPWPVDFEQALLRLPRQADPAVVAGAAELTSPAGQQFAAWLAAGGLPDPVSTRWEQRPATVDQQYAPVARRAVAAVRPARDGGLRLERQLLTLEPRSFPQLWPDDFRRRGDVLAMVLPHHREVTAAWMLSELAALADQDQRDGAEVLPLLAECGGPVGPALAYGLAYSLGARHQESRLAAVDALVTLAARPEPFAPAVGAALADLCADGLVKLSRLVPALAEIHLAGASVALWELLTAALPPLLPTGQRGLPDLLELSTQVAGAVRARSAIPGLAEIAARPGTTRLVKEAKRLHSVLHP